MINKANWSVSHCRRLFVSGALFILLAIVCLACVDNGSTETLTPGENPTWLNQVIQELKNEPVANPPASVTRYEYKGQIVYYVPPQYADIWSTLYGNNGEIVGHPEGGISGNGDGRAQDFIKDRKNAVLVWADQRKYDPDMIKTAAPIGSVEILIAESYPQQYFALVVSGLPNSCAKYGGYYLSRNGDSIQIDMVNWIPANPETECAEIYTEVQHNIPLGSDFESGQTYVIEVNDVTEILVAQ